VKALTRSVGSLRIDDVELKRQKRQPKIHRAKKLKLSTIAGQQCALFQSVYRATTKQRRRVWIGESGALVWVGRGDGLFGGLRKKGEVIA
jgi:hypothetical protein